MNASFLAVPFGLGFIELIIIAVVIVLIVKAVTGAKRGKNAIAGILIAIGALIIIPLFLMSMLFVGRVSTHTVMTNHGPATVISATEQARLETERMQQEVQNMAAEVRAKTDEIAERTAISVDGEIRSELMAYEDPETQTARVVDVTVVDNPVPDPVVVTAVDAPDPEASFPVEHHNGFTVAGEPWTSAIEEHQDFEADVYPSIEAAAEALGRRVGQHLVQIGGDDSSEQPFVYVWREETSEGINPHVTREVLEAAARGLKQKLLNPSYVSVERPVSGIEVRVALQDITFENHNRWREHTESKSGGIALRVTMPNESFSLSTRFVDAPWLQDRAGFVRKYSNGDWLIAYSDSNNTTHDEARWDAVKKAAEVLLPLARTRINQMSGSDQAQFEKQMAKNPNWLRGRVTDELVSRNLVTDQFTQQFDRSYGPVWREAVLVDASPDRIESIARSLVQGINIRVVHKRGVLASVIGMAVLLLGAYGFLNIATKGYYSWTLRLVLIAGLGALVVVFLNVV